MSGLGYGYDPARIVALRSHTLEAIDHLRAIGCDDPDAAEAMRVVRLLCQNLEESWLPLVEAIHSSTAMTTWRRSTGRDTSRHDAVVTSLVHQLGARSGWIGTSGLEDLADRRLVGRLDELTSRLTGAVAEGTPFAATWRYLDRVLDEIERRMIDDTFGILVWEQSGAAGVTGLVDVLDTIGRLADLDLLTGTGMSREAVGETSTRIAILLASAVDADPGARAVLVERITTSSHLARIVAAESPVFDDTTLHAVTTELVHYTAGTGRWEDRPRVVDRTRDVDDLLRAVAAEPLQAVDLLSDVAVATAIVTSPHLDTEAVEDVVNAALSAPMGYPTTRSDALEVLRTLVNAAGHHELNTGTRRGVASASGALLPSIAPVLDGRLPVDVAVADSVVRLGSYDDLALLIGQVLDDEPAQLTLGVVVGAYRSDQAAAAATSIVDRPTLLHADARARLAAALADASRVLTLIEHSTDQRDELHAFRHGVNSSNAASIVSLLGSMVSWYPPTAPLAGRISSVTTRGVVAAIGSTRPATVPDTGMAAQSAVDFLAIVVTLPLHDTVLRERLGLGDVPESTWDELDGLLEQLDEADDTDHDRQSAVRSRIRAVVDAHPDLDTYLEGVAVASGDAALARP